MINLTSNGYRYIINLFKREIWPITGGFLFLAIFLFRYANINPDFYTIRDDGVITLSHARNFIDYGFIGVNPSGERVEGYSAPFQFLVFAAIYALFGVGYASYAAQQTYICTFLLGYITSLYFSENRAFSIAATLIIAITLTTLTSFVQWHGSGMENALTHVLFALSAYTFVKFSRIRKVDIRMSVILFFASISRIDGIYHIFPILLIFAIYWIVAENKKDGFIFMSATVLLWILYNAWRFYYFGDIRPNTAFAQNISITEHLKAIIHPSENTIKPTLDLSKTIFSNHGGYFLVIALALIPFFSARKDYLLLLLISSSFIITAYLNPFLFGPTRLDVTRSTTQMAFFVAIATMTVTRASSRKALTLYPLLIPAAIIIGRLNYVSPYNMCCNTDTFNKFRLEFTHLMKSENLPRPTVSNPDLGIMSWYKQFNIVDLGMLGSQIFAKLQNGSVLSHYLFNFAAPDFIESHEDWSCRYYDAIFSNTLFRSLYEPVNEKIVHWKSCDNKPLPVGIWIRKDIKKGSPSKERTLIDSLITRLDVGRINIELDECQKNNSELSACAYVARTAYRFLPEFRASGDIDSLRDVFRNSRTKDFDNFLLYGFSDGRSNNSAIKFIFNDYLNNAKFTELGTRNSFSIYTNNKNILFLDTDCRNKATPPFYLHIQPKYPESTHTDNFLNLDFRFKSTSHAASGVCYEDIKLPEWEIKMITTGQWLPSKKVSLWELKREYLGSP